MIKVFRTIYLIGTWLFLLGVMVQVFLAGMAVIPRLTGWSNHGNLGHALALPLLVMLVSAYLGRLPGKEKRLTWLLFVVYIIQADVIIFLRQDAPLVSALHPVLALIDFALALSLARRAWPMARQAEEDALPSPELLAQSGD
jgi:hypothetical protein